jgi:hypothetical protein
MIAAPPVCFRKHEGGVHEGSVSGATTTIRRSVKKFERGDGDARRGPTDRTFGVKATDGFESSACFKPRIPS